MFPTPSEFDSLLYQLEDVNLSEDSAEKQLYDLFKKLQTLPVVSYSLPANSPLTRARLNNDGERYSQVHQVWHKPTEFNTGFGRASNPYINVMYGAINPYTDHSINKPDERITALCEISNIYFTEPEDLKTEVVTFARWVPGKELNMVCPFDFSELSLESPIMNELNEAYLKVIRDNESFKEQITRFHAYISSQFSKYPIAHEYEYKTTALFTEMILSMGFDGVIYPSVKTDLKGINVAINSEFVEKNFKLFAVGECTHYRKRKYSYVNNDLLTDKIKEDGTFQLSADHPYSLSDQQIQEIIERNSN
jgi:hypothetical protein